jgi:hypothetical protein
MNSIKNHDHSVEDDIGERQFCKILILTSFTFESSMLISFHNNGEVDKHAHRFADF